MDIFMLSSISISAIYATTKKIWKKLTQNENFNISNEEMESVYGIIEVFHTKRNNQEGKGQGTNIFQTGIKLELSSTKPVNWTTVALSWLIDICIS